MLNFTDLSIRRGTRLLFAGATFSLFRGEKVGITGENGSGKSSLLALVRGELQPDAGSFEMPAGLAIAHVSQELEATDRRAHRVRARRRCASCARSSGQLRGRRGGHDGARLGELHAPLRGHRRL